MRARTWVTGGIVAATVSAVTITMATSAAAVSSHAPGPMVTVNAQDRLGTIAPDAVGVDTPFFNANLGTASVAQLKQAGVRMLDFDPSEAIDLYNWKTNTLSADPDAARDEAEGETWSQLGVHFDFDQFESVAKAADLPTTVHVNYGTGTADEAAAWVNYANNVKHDNVQDWIIGCDTYFDQVIDPTDRIPLNPDGTTVDESAKVDAQNYGRNVIKFAQKMRAADPHIKIGIEMFPADPAQLNDPIQGPTLTFLNQWDQALMKTPGLADVVDFADIHWYPEIFPTSTMNLDYALQSASTVAPSLRNVRSMLDAASGPRHHIAIVTGEYDLSPYTATGSEIDGTGAFLADTGMTLLEQGSSSIAWLGLYAQTDPGLGIESYTGCTKLDATCPDPTYDGPLPSEYAMRLLNLTAVPHGVMVAASTNTPDVSAHAVARPDGSLAVMLVNTSGTATRTVNLNGAGYGQHGSVRVYQTTGLNIRTSSQQAGNAVNLPPYSVTVVISGH
jgi:hypothetical protein